MSRYYIWTIGCQMNKADSEHIAAYLEQIGYSPVTTVEDADLAVLNSCVVRQSAEDKVVNKLNSLKGLKKKHPSLMIALTGCLVNSEVEELKGRFPWVDLFFQPQQWSSLYDWVEHRPLSNPEERLIPSRPSVSTFVPIIKGCDNFCSYCIVPYRRGREKSRPLKEILKEVEVLVHRGTKEVTLLGQNVDSYGRDLHARPELADLLGELNGIEGLLRIRFLTNHPKDMSQRLIKAVAQLDKVCEHISLPIQAGDDEILRRMRRGYTVEQYHQLVQQIRHNIPGVALSTDVIVGFPGESERQFESTFDLLHDIRCDTVYVASYSPRPGTLASRKFKDDIAPEEKERRRQKIEALQESIATEINARLLGKTVEVLVEEKKKGKWQGRTRTNKLVFFTHGADLVGQLVRVNINNTSAWSLQGRVVE